MKRRFESLLELSRTALRTLQRFPLAILAAAVAAVVTHLLVEGGSDQARVLEPILLAAIPGIPLFFAVQVLAESRAWGRRLRLAAPTLAALGLVLYYASLPSPLKEADWFRFALVYLAALLFSSFAPFIGRGDLEGGFWEYNKTLLLRILTAALYAGVLTVGLDLALAASDALLGLDVEPETYLKLFIWIGFVYTTGFTLAGVPANVRKLESIRGYPTGLRIFTQYVLIPLVVLYLLILYLYLGKILVQWDLPEGWVGYPVIGVSIAGILALLLVHPIRKRAERAWVVAFARAFYWALFPMIGLIAVAIGVRIGDYGLTERRYIVVVLTAWLAGIALYYTLRGNRRIRLIPMSLCAIMALSAFGPWSATSLSRRSQIGRLQNLLADHGLLIDGVLSGSPADVPFEATREVSAILRYLGRTHGLESIRDWYPDSVTLPDQLGPREAVAAIGLDYVGRSGRPGGWVLNLTPPDVIPIEDFDLLVHVTARGLDSGVDLEVRRIGPDLELVIEGDRLTLRRPDADELLTLMLQPDLSRLRDSQAAGRSSALPEVPYLEAENDRLRLRVYPRHVRGVGGADAAIAYISGVVLIERKLGTIDVDGSN